VKTVTRLYVPDTQCRVTRPTHQPVNTTHSHPACCTTARDSLTSFRHNTPTLPAIPPSRDNLTSPQTPNTLSHPTCSTRARGHLTTLRQKTHPSNSYQPETQCTHSTSQLFAMLIWVSNLLLGRFLAHFYTLDTSTAAEPTVEMQYRKMLLM